MRHGATPVLAALLIGAITSPKACLAGPEPLPDSQLGIRTAPLLLLSRPDVRNDIGLDAKQAVEAERAITDLYVRAYAVKDMKGEQALAARSQINEAMLRWLQTWLNDEQRRRLLQVDLQWEGPSAIVTRPVVAETLDLSPEQRATVKQMVDEHHRRRAQGSYQWSDEHALNEKVRAVLTEPQQRRWLAILGRPFSPQLSRAGSNPPRR